MAAKPPYTPNERAFWACPAHVMMAGVYILLGGTIATISIIAAQAVNCTS